MGMIDDVMKALDRWDVWREIQALPAKWRALEKRVGDIEEKLGGKWPADVCRFCGERGVRLNVVWPVNSKGITTEDWKCERCGQSDRRSKKVT